MDNSISTRNSIESRMDIDAIIREGVELRCTVDALKARLDEVNRQLAEMAVFPEGRNTAWICGSEYKARVVNRVYEKWDQSLLDEAREAMGHETFALLFKQVWEPVSRRDVQGFLAHGPVEFAEKLRGALSTKVTPAVSFVTQDEKVDGHNGSGRHGAPADARVGREEREERGGGILRDARVGIGEREGRGGDPTPHTASGETRERREPHETRERGERGGNSAPEGPGFPRDFREHRDPRDFRRERPARPRGFSESTGHTPFGLPHFLSRAFGSASQV